MLHKVKNGEILKGLPELKALLPSIERKKKLLLEMAARGEPKPPSTTNLGQVFRKYTQTSSKMYDHKFTERIRELRPDWLATLEESINSKKRILIDMAAKAKGGPKPSRKTSMGKFLYICTLKSSIYFDPELTNEIKKLAPNWLTPSRPERMSQIKQLLLVMASKGEPKPPRRSPLYQSLHRFTLKSCSSYDPVFDMKIRKLAPHWFNLCSTR